MPDEPEEFDGRGPCTACDGTGWDDGPCFSCDGVGWID